MKTQFFWIKSTYSPSFWTFQFPSRPIGDQPSEGLAPCRPEVVMEPWRSNVEPLVDLKLVVNNNYYG